MRLTAASACRALINGALVAWILSIAPAAHGLSMSPNPLPVLFSSGVFPNFSGELRLIEVTTGVPTDGVVQDGTVNASDISFVFEFTLNPDAGNDLFFIQLRHPQTADPVGSAGVVWTGTGTIPGPGVDPTMDLTPTSIDYLALGAVTPGDSMDYFFASISSIPLGAPIEFFAAGLTHGTTAQGTAVVVPEPATALLLAAGLAGLALRRRH